MANYLAMNRDELTAEKAALEAEEWLITDRISDAVQIAEVALCTVFSTDPVLTSRCFACHATSVCLSFGVMRYPSFSFPAYGNNLGSFRYILFSQEIPVSLLPVYWKHRIKFRHHSNPAIHHIRQLLVLYGT